MSDKIALVSCSGLSPLGLVVRAATVELALDNENIVAAYDVGCVSGSNVYYLKMEIIFTAAETVC